MTATKTQPATGRTVELAGYRSDTGPRRIVGQRIDCAVQLRDEPTDNPGRVFVIETGLHAYVAGSRPQRCCPDNAPSIDWIRRGAIGTTGVCPSARRRLTDPSGGHAVVNVSNI